MTTQTDNHIHFIFTAKKDMASANTNANTTGLSSNHIRIHGQCGACGQLFMFSERPIIASTQKENLRSSIRNSLC